MMGSMEHGTPRGLAAFTRTMRGLLAVSHDEFVSRHNMRESDTLDQMAAIARRMENAELRYKDLVA